MRHVGAREEFPLERVKVVVKVLFKLDNIRLFRFAGACIEECVVKVVVVADLCEEIAICFHDSNRSPEQARSHSKTVGRMVVAVDVAPVVVVDVVVAADQRPDRSPFTQNFHCGFKRSAKWKMAYQLSPLYFMADGKTSTVTGRVALKSCFRAAR